MHTISDTEVARRRDALETRTGTWEFRSLAQAFDLLAARNDDRAYVIGDTITYTYTQVRLASIGIAGALQRLGVTPGDRVAMLVDNSPDYASIKIAIARLGAIAVPLNYSYKRDEIRARVAQARASVLISIERSAATDFVDAFDGMLPGWRDGARSADLPDLQHIVLVADLMKQAMGRPDQDGIAELTAAIRPDDVCDIVFTSGTTGHALGAELTHDAVLRSGYGSAYHRAFDDGWRISFALPLYHVFGYIEGMVAAMFVGGAIAPLPVFNPKTTLAIIEKHGINEVLFVPTMTVAVVDQAVKQHYDLSSLQSVFSAAAPAPVWLWERVLSDLAPTMVFTGYGQTEVSAATALTLPGDSIQTVSAVVGTTKLGGVAATDPSGRLATYRTIDPFTGEPLPEGETGELSVRGVQVTHRYFDNPERTAASIDADGWLRTGDLGFVDADGYLHLSGRSSELFKVGGELVSPAEVEQLLTGIDGVSQAYVAGVPDERFGEVGWAWVVLSEGASLDEHALVAHTREHLAPFKVPRGITLLAAEELPMTTTGKIQKFLLVQSRQAAV
ncbi:MAG: AMP-binding protein [Microbacteriaceae bacterium]|jgi:fatty-acyl-CoA synthase|nr:AMP-binding protein [Microbacteriaceae bacterium]